MPQSRACPPQDTQDVAGSVGDLRTIEVSLDWWSQRVSLHLPSCWIYLSLSRMPDAVKRFEATNPRTLQ